MTDTLTKIKLLRRQIARTFADSLINKTGIKNDIISL